MPLPFIILFSPHQSVAVFKGLSMAASSSLPIPPPKREYNVFLNFSGPDTRESFISHLRADLERNGFHTFRDDENLDRGQSIGPELSKAIANSSMSLVVFSKNYFASTWCLYELEKIMECRKNLQHFVFPIFYKIEPSDIRHLKGSIVETLAKTLAKHEEVPKMEKWRSILTEAANLGGIVSNHYRDEASLVQRIIKEVQGKLNMCIDLNVATHPVGIKPRLQKLIKELCLESFDDVRIIAIWGVGGLGKTTIAKAAYNHIRSRFEGCSFVDNVREKWEQSNKGLLALQNQIQFDISKNKSYKIRNSHEGVEFLKHRAFYRRKVLLVLDDVDHVKQLNALAIDPRFLYRGSRIIVTTRDISSLNSLTKYELEPLNKDESLQLFSLHAFNQHNPPEGFMELSNTVVDYAGGIPFVLEFWGCFLNGNNDQSEWRSAIAKMKKIPHDNVQRKLRISFDSLDENEKKLFLDIAFFLFGERENFTIQVLQDYEIFPKIGFRRMKNLCLLKCVGSEIVMHDILKQMDREIVGQEIVDYPEKHSRLWDCNDAQVLKNCEVLDKLKFLDPSYCESLTTTPNFSGLHNLEKLNLNDCVRLQEVDKSIRHLSYYTTDDDTINDDDVNYYTIDDDTFDDDDDVNYYTNNDDTFDDDDDVNHYTIDDDTFDDDDDVNHYTIDDDTFDDDDVNHYTNNDDTFDDDDVSYYTIDDHH